MYRVLVIFQVNISLYSWKSMYVSWKCKYGELVIFFHKTVNKDWNLFNLSEQSPENSIKSFRKFKILNFHLEISRSWIFTLWNHILQTQTSLLQPIHVYIYIYNNELIILYKYIYLMMRTFLDLKGCCWFSLHWFGIQRICNLPPVIQIKMNNHNWILF